MLETEFSLRTWRLHAAPDSGGIIATEALADHRLEYLNYEGPVSGQRGSVSRWDAGTYDVLVDKSDAVEVQLHGGRMNGIARITRDSDCHSLTFQFIPA